MNRTHALALVLGLAFLAANGCTRGTEHRTTIGQSEPIPAIAQSAPGLLPTTERSLLGADRSHWEMDPIVVSPDGSRSWFWRVHMVNRNGGAHPTALTALDAHQTDSVRDLIGIPFRDAGQAILFPLRIVPVLSQDEPGEEAGPYERAKTGLWRNQTRSRAGASQ